jgi:predicted extracellular nuclease
LEFKTKLEALVPADSLFVLLGDMNATLDEPPLQVFEGALWDVFRDQTDPYSYVYDGQSMLLDHILVSPGSTARKHGIWHINADESSARDYRNSIHYHADPFRSSDHDPVWLDLEF